MDTLAPLKLKAKGADKTLQGAVAWDGYKLAASVRTEQGRIRDASLKGALDNGLMGMILSAMEEKGFVPAATESDGTAASLLDKTAEQSREAAVEAMGCWAGGGKKAMKLLFLPEKAFQGACAAFKADPKAPLAGIPKPEAVPYPPQPSAERPLASGLCRFLREAWGSGADRPGGRRGGMDAPACRRARPQATCPA
ncbi:MAG: hypothetical protein K6E40_00650 [Desulfovibrio sp.]|nr:hypothetical protein [Desulfovibrio sp.]